MSTLHAQLVQLIGFPAQTAVHGESVSVTVGSTTIACYGVIHRGAMTAGGPDPGFPVYDTTIELSQADVPTMAAGAIVTAKKRMTDSATTNFIVRQILDQDGGVWHLGLQG